jgi:hypothetical protein
VIDFAMLRRSLRHTPPSKASSSGFKLTVSCAA